MALSLSPHQLKHDIHIPSPSLASNAPLQSHLIALPITATPRQFAKVAHDGLGHKTLSMNVNGKLVSSSRALPDLPSWTPLKTLGEHEGSSVSDSEPEVDDLPTGNATDSAMKQLRGSPINAQETVKDTVTKPTLDPPGSSELGAQPYKAKKARFDGILITTKPPPHKKKNGAQTKPASSTRATRMSLVDALARTFDANRHIEDPFTRRSLTGLDHHDNASAAPQTDAETGTEAEDDQLQLNTRLAREPLKRRDPRTSAITVSANASEASSEDATSLQRGIPQPERLPAAKRLKPIQYESNAASIDTALGTVQAPITWDAELDFFTKGDEIGFTSVQTIPPASEDDRMAVDKSDSIPGSPRKAFVPPSTQVGNEWRMPTSGNPRRAVLSPYVSRGAKFRQRLHTIFGENTTVRTDRVAKPRPVDHDFFAAFDEPDEEPSPNLSASTVSVSFASTADGASAIPSTRITSQSPDIPSADISMDQLPGGQLSETASVTKPVFNANEERMSGWIAALQRIVKGKVHIQEEDLETLSVVLAEIESAKDSLDSAFMTSELHERIKQLSKLHEIPFGDRNKLRQRAEKISQTWLFTMEPGALNS